jgi:hypothetical protein
MNELVNQIAQRTGIGEDKARQAAEAAISFLKSKYPALSGHLDSLVQGGGGSDEGQLSQRVEQGLGGILGKKSA